MPNPKIAVVLTEPLTTADTPSALLVALRAAVRRDQDAEAQFEEARTERDAWLRAGRHTEPKKLTWPVMMQAAGLSRKALGDVLKSEGPAAPSTDSATVLESIADTSAAFWSAKERKAGIRAERNEHVRRAYMGDVPVSDLTKILECVDIYVYDILHHRRTK
jgi:hypothetical protein